MSAVPSVVVGTGSLADRVILIAGAGGGFGSAAAVAC
ncbi:MAG: short-chain dehydrogenase, partial [Stenotrophomonas bentonitica]